MRKRLGLGERGGGKIVPGSWVGGWGGRFGVGGEGVLENNLIRNSKKEWVGCISVSNELSACCQETWAEVWMSGST